MMEVWKSIPGYGDWYQVSDQGKVRSYAPVGRKPKNGIENRRLVPRVLKQSRSKEGGYLQVDLQYAGERTIGRIHRLVAEAFIGPSPFEGAVVMHKDDDATNNHYTNLAWGTQGDNMDDKVSKDRQRRGTQMYSAKLTDTDIPKIRGYDSVGWTRSDIGRLFGVSPATIQNIIVGRTWKSVPGIEMP